MDKNAEAKAKTSIHISHGNACVIFPYQHEMSVIVVLPIGEMRNI